MPTTATTPKPSKSAAPVHPAIAALRSWNPPGDWKTLPETANIIEWTPDPLNKPGEKATKLIIKAVRDGAPKYVVQFTAHKSPHDPAEVILAGLDESFASYSQTWGTFASGQMDHPG